jgi:bifunctional DNA-binding transcriptional regulator/antitoxin component of YhaV-PrlF toxin-antitoxin module
MDIRMGQMGQIALPPEICRRYGLEPDAQVRLVEARGAILLVPLRDFTIEPALQQELADWQTAGMEAWDMFSYDADR